jgi:hypothetical protein
MTVKVNQATPRDQTPFATREVSDKPTPRGVSSQPDALKSYAKVQQAGQNCCMALLGKGCKCVCSFTMNCMLHLVNWIILCCCSPEKKKKSSSQSVPQPIPNPVPVTTQTPVPTPVNAQPQRKITAEEYLQQFSYCTDEELIRHFNAKLALQALREVRSMKGFDTCMRGICTCSNCEELLVELIEWVEFDECGKDIDKMRNYLSFSDAKLFERSTSAGYVFMRAYICHMLTLKKTDTTRENRQIKFFDLLWEANPERFKEMVLSRNLPFWRDFTPEQRQAFNVWADAEHNAFTLCMEKEGQKLVVRSPSQIEHPENPKAWPLIISNDPNTPFAMLGNALDMYEKSPIKGRIIDLPRNASEVVGHLLDVCKSAQDVEELVHFLLGHPEDLRNYFQFLAQVSLTGQGLQVVMIFARTCVNLATFHEDREALWDLMKVTNGKLFSAALQALWQTYTPEHHITFRKALGNSEHDLTKGIRRTHTTYCRKNNISLVY